MRVIDKRPCPHCQDGGALCGASPVLAAYGRNVCKKSDKRVCQIVRGGHIIRCLNWLGICSAQGQFNPGEQRLHQGIGNISNFSKHFGYQNANISNTEYCGRGHKKVWTAHHHKIACRAVPQGAGFQGSVIVEVKRSGLLSGGGFSLLSASRQR